MVTSAIWKATQRPWLTIFAPVLISFSLRLVSDQSLMGSGVVGGNQVRFAELTGRAWSQMSDLRRESASSFRLSGPIHETVKETARGRARDIADGLVELTDIDPSDRALLIEEAALAASFLKANRATRDRRQTAPRHADGTGEPRCRARRH